MSEDVRRQAVLDKKRTRDRAYFQRKYQERIHGCTSENEREEYQRELAQLHAQFRDRKLDAKGKLKMEALALAMLTKPEDVQGTLAHDPSQEVDRERVGRAWKEWKGSKAGSTAALPPVAVRDSWAVFLGHGAPETTSSQAGGTKRTLCTNGSTSSSRVPACSMTETSTVLDVLSFAQSVGSGNHSSNQDVGKLGTTGTAPLSSVLIPASLRKKQRRIPDEAVSMHALPNPVTIEKHNLGDIRVDASNAQSDIPQTCGLTSESILGSSHKSNSPIDCFDETERRNELEDMSDECDESMDGSIDLAP